MIKQRFNLQLFNQATPDRLCACDLSNKWEVFPPKDFDQCKYPVYGAWYSGDNEEIFRHWGGSSSAKNNNAFWSKKPDNGLARVHLPIASDMSATSADLLFADFPDMSIPEADGEGANSRAREAFNRLRDIIAEGDVHSRLLEAGEACSALGGVYLKPVWDKDLVPYPILSIAQADNAIPEFKYGILIAVTFWKIIREEEDEQGEKAIYRHLERHEKGKIYNAIYKGKSDELGEQVPMAGFAGYEDLEPNLETGYEGLLVRYVPNIKPNRLMRGSSLGQSDLAGAETIFDAIDEVYSSLMRDIRLARARLLVPESYLDFEEDTKGQSQATFDGEQSVFVKLSADPLMSKETGITANQFAIRTEEHISTLLDLIERVVVHAGYSPQTFGLKLEGGESGTALNIRERKTFITRQRKWKYWASALEDIFEMMLFIDNVHLGNGTPIEFRPSLQLNDTVSRDPLSIANTIKLLNDAQALSIDTKVRMLHPEWEEEQIIAEIEAIKEDYGLNEVASPDQLDDMLDETRGAEPPVFGQQVPDEEE